MLHEGLGGGQELAGLYVAGIYLRAQEIRELPPDRRAGLMIDLHMITVSDYAHADTRRVLVHLIIFRVHLGIL